MLVFVSIVLVVILASAGFAVDLGSWYHEAVEMQNGVDAAALAGVIYMPADYASAQSTATTTMGKNGFNNGQGGISVSVSKVVGYPHRLEVCATDNKVQRYFSAIVGAHPVIHKCATAEYILPVQLGSPLNEFDQPTLGVWPAVNGYCTAKEDGDLLLSGFQGSRPGGGGATCGPPGSASSDYNAAGYAFDIGVVDNSQSTNIDLYNAAFTGSSPDMGLGNFSGAPTTIDTIYSVYDATQTPLDPSDDPLLFTTTVASGDAGWNGWRTLYTVPAGAPAGRYRVQVTTKAGQANSAGSNSFGIRAYVGGAFTQCSTIPGAGNFSATCPEVFAENNLSVFANQAGSTADFYLANVDASHAGKQMVIQLFDPGEGGQTIEVLDPSGNPVSFDYQNVEGFSPNYSGTTSALNVSGSGPQPPNRASNSKFNERKLQISINLPASYTSTYGTNTWWKLRYRFSGSSVTDRTTWSVDIVGEPVRLVPVG